MASQSPASLVFTQPFIQVQINEKKQKLRDTGLCAGNSPVTGEFPAQMASNAEKCFHLMTSSWQNEYVKYVFRNCQEFELKMLSICLKSMART